MSLARSLGHTRLLSLRSTKVLSDTATSLQHAWCAPSATFQSAWKPLLGTSCLPYTVQWSYSTAAQETERTGKGHYVDRLRVEIQAGRGGSGCVAFWKSAAKGTIMPETIRSLKLHIKSTILAQANFNLLTAAMEAMVATLWSRLPPRASTLAALTASCRCSTASGSAACHAGSKAWAVSGNFRVHNPADQVAIKRNLANTDLTKSFR